MNVGTAGRFFHLGTRGTGAAIGNVVFHRVVEQHRVLRHDANGLAHAGLGDLLDVLPVKQNPPPLHVIKAKQQAGQRGLARAGRADDRHRFARRHLKAHIVQDGAGRVVGEVDMLKTHLAVADVQRFRTGHIGHLAFALHQGEHFFKVGQALLDFAVQHAQKSQRNVELDHERVDHHQITQRHVAVHHALGGAPQHGDQANRNDELLAGVEQAQGALAFERRFAELG